MPAMRAALHHLRTDRSRAVLRHQEGRAPRGFRPAEALHRAQEGDREARHLAGTPARDRRRHRGRATPVRPGRDPERRDRRDGDGSPARPRRGRVHPVRVGLPRVHGPPAGQARDRTGPELPPPITLAAGVARAAGFSRSRLCFLTPDDAGRTFQEIRTAGKRAAPRRAPRDEREPAGSLSYSPARRVLGVATTPAALHIPELVDEPGSVHGSSVARVDEPGGSIDDVDALLTDRPGVALFATFADCYPIVLWDPERKVAGLVHAGWRGTRAGVATAAVKFMQREFGSRRIQAGIGPGICGRCYEVGPEVATQFDAKFAREGPGDRFLLDLAAANRAQLENEGVRPIFDIGICTKEHYLFPSHRRHPDGTRFGAIVAIR